MAKKAQQNNHHQRAMVESVDLVYAQALLEIAEQNKQLEVIADEVQQLGQLMEQQPELRALLASLALSVDDRAKVIERIFKGRVSDLLFRFLLVINDKNRLGKLPGIVSGFANLVDQKHGVVEVDAFVAKRLTDPQAKSLATNIGKAIGREAVLHQYEDPALLGGLKLRIGDEVIDGSVRTQLRLMREKMIEAGRDKARLHANQD